ncbi:zinc transporter ZIP8 [Acyrthosiphon pisum]|uniref:Zinc transporter ZIP8 n=1 Tax=Acyrthosiphon pisum TaxID=7029 RepID=A0A8R1W3X3_ACYPI|nr:zinc transporter ZIP8 [Acyrthosiphon pisum]|eukprot:XP_001952790.2 PREDICTED: zinc transporter ZIP8 [Acyrthosiphon pisum]
MASTFISLVIFGFSLIWYTCSADPIAMDNCWRKVWSLTPSCTEMDGSTDSSMGNPRLCVFQSRCDNASRPNSCTVEFVSYEENYPIRSMAIPADNQMPISLSKKSTTAEAWIGGFVSVGIISLSGLVGAIFWPLLNDPNRKKTVMRLLLGLATGSLSSSAVFQLLPEAFKIPESFPDYRHTALIMWLSLWGLYMFETLAGIIFHKEEKKIGIDELSPSLQLTNGNGTEMKQISHGHGHSHNHKLTNKSMDEESPISTLALLVLFGDSLHNIIDGMSIGAAFSENVTTGISISIAIACEEFPHEIGDFAILIQSGMSFRRALSFNFLSACTAFIGLVIGICLGNMEYSGFVFSFAGGLFLFITLTHLTPEMKSMIDENLTESKSSAYTGLLLQNIGMLTGATLMYIITFSGFMKI